MGNILPFSNTANEQTEVKKKSQIKVQFNRLNDVVVVVVDDNNELLK